MNYMWFAAKLPSCQIMTHCNIGLRHFHNGPKWLGLKVNRSMLMLGDESKFVSLLLELRITVTMVVRAAMTMIQIRPGSMFWLRGPVKAMAHVFIRGWVKLWWSISLKGMWIDHLWLDAFMKLNALRPCLISKVSFLKPKNSVVSVRKKLREQDLTSYVLTIRQVKLVPNYKVVMRQRSWI